MPYKIATFGLFITDDCSDDPDPALRDSLTVLAILLICLLTAALVGPYFVDWNAHRALIEAKLSEAAGTRIAIRGPIKVRLLPQPKFRLGQVTIGEAATGQQALTADELDVDIVLTALMRGDVQVGEALLRAPRLDLAADPDGAFRPKLAALGDPKRVQFKHVRVTRGLVTLTRPGRPAVAVDNLDFDGEATSLLGPFKATGRFGPDDDPHAFRLSTGAVEAGGMRLKLSLDPTKTLPAVDLDGAASDAGRRFMGLLALKGAVPLDGSDASIPWTMTGHLDADAEKAAVADLELRAGADMRAVNATGTGEMTLGPQPQATLRLHGPQLGLDRLAVAPENSPTPVPTGLDLLARLNRTFGLGNGFKPPLGIDVGYGFDTLSTGPLTILGIAGRLAVDEGKAARVRLTATGPDAASLTLDGDFEAGVAPVFRGRMDASTRDVPRLADWLAPLAPEAAAWAKATIPARAAGVSGTVDLSGVGVATRDAVLRLDRSEIKGTVTYTRAVGRDRARLFADVTSDGLDIDELPDLGAASQAWADTDLDIAVAAHALKVQPAGLAAVDAGTLALRLHKTADRIALDTLSADLGSARLTATGSLDAHAGMLDAHVDAPELDTVSALLARLLPGAPTAWLAARAPALSPARLDLGVKAARADDGSLLPTGLTLDGTLNGTHVKAGLDPDTPGDLDPATAIFTLDLDAATPEGSLLVRQFGVPTVSGGAVPPLGMGRLKGRAHGSAGDGFVATVDASLGGMTMTFQGRTKPSRGNGHLTLRGADLAPLLRSSGLAFGETGAAWPVEADADLSWHEDAVALRRLQGRAGSVGFGGDLDATLTSGVPASSALSERPRLFGSVAIDRLTMAGAIDAALGPAPGDAADLWSQRPFGMPLAQWPRTAVAVKVKSVGLRSGLEARDASFTLRADRSGLTLADFTGTLGSGTLGGFLTLRRDGASASVSGSASWGGIGIDWPGLAGRTGATLDFGGTGETPAALVASLAGIGSVTVGDGKIARLDPGALVRNARAAETDTSEVDADEIRKRVVPDLDRAPLRLGDVSAQATLAAGTVRVGPIHAAGGEWTADTDAAFDLKTFGFSSKTVLRVRQPLPDWKGDPPQVTLLLNGPPEAPRRDIDATAFVNALQSRAIARDQERIDTMQQDIRERAFFNRKLKAIEAEQAQVRAKAAAEAAALRQMRPNPPGASPSVPSPPARPTLLPGATVPAGTGLSGTRTQPASRASRPTGTRAAPPATLSDPLSAGPY